MKSIFERMEVALKHLAALHDVFLNEENFQAEEKLDFVFKALSLYS